MAQEKIAVTVKGKSPLLMHRFPLEEIDTFEKLPKEKQAEIAAYRDTDDRLYIPGTNIQRSLINGATYSKGKGRGSLQKPVAASVFISPEVIHIKPNEYVIDSRAVVVPATKGRIVRHRPRIDHWEIGFDLEYDDTLLTEKQVRKVVDDTLDRVGLLDFRPEKKGPFGRGMVTSWQKEKA